MRGLAARAPDGFFHGVEKSVEVVPLCGKIAESFSIAAKFPARGIVPAACVAIEDTADGIASARGAGIPVVAVATNLSAAALRAAGAAAVVATLAELSPEKLGTLAGLGR